jgi:superoxide reductase
MEQGVQNVWLCMIPTRDPLSYALRKEKIMTKQSGIYKCAVCGNIIEVIHTGAGDLVCCGQLMELLRENTTDASREKHVPVIEKMADGVKVKVGSAAHPMEEKHYIEWIEMIAEGKVCRQFLKPGQAPEAVFPVKAATMSARAYCNLHALWKA